MSQNEGPAVSAATEGAPATANPRKEKPPLARICTILALAILAYATVMFVQQVVVWYSPMVRTYNAMVNTAHPRPDLYPQLHAQIFIALVAAVYFVLLPVLAAGVLAMIALAYRRR